jgi:serine/threonine protein kinase
MSADPETDTLIAATEGLIGRTIQPYKILSLLGKGGMGEVYLAEDMRLQRKVALKFLPPQFAQDAERLRRFELEAHATGSLNHPNILTIYDIGTHDLSQGFQHPVASGSFRPMAAGNRNGGAMAESCITSRQMAS